MSEVVHEGEWLAFRHIKPDREMKTEMWAVTTRGAACSVLGWIRWYSQWRRYVYNPASADILLDEGCLGDIKEFVGKQTAERKKTWKSKRQLAEEEANAVLGVE